MEIQRWRRRRKRLKRVRNFWFGLYFVFGVSYAVGSVVNPALLGNTVASGLFIGASSGSLVALADFYANLYLRL